ncbi:MAG TPA: glycosyltransferase, partial [Candidatus Melainabacteria bacterium]|nr:glycosyltransferase [Candidatus Melainabacteria bacterium]
MGKAVRILVLHWRGIEHTRACLTSIRSLHYDNFKVLLVDNGSEQDDGALLKSEFPEIDLLRLDSNRGFSGGCNAGIGYCLDDGADYIWLLNNDATVDSGTLSALVDAAESDTAAGAVSACIVERDRQSGKIVKRV